MIVRQVQTDAILALRHRMLRQELPLESAHFEGDDEPTTIHLAAFDNDGQTLIGCVTLLRRPFQKAQTQLRGMAVAPEAQGRGAGRVLLEAAHDAVGDAAMWCNARTPAAGFYERHGWRRVGDEFVVPTAGPHVKMVRTSTGG